jgi:parallel beta-helix repeat protein
LYIKNCSPQIYGNTIHDNKIGIEGNNATPEIIRNNISSNSHKGMFFYHRSKPIISENILKENFYGIYLSSVETGTIDNNSFHNSTVGIYSLESTNCIISGNNFYNTENDIYMYDSEIVVSNCVFSYLQNENIDCRRSIIKVDNCEFYSLNSLDIYNSTAIINNNLIYGSLSMNGGSTGTISNNSFFGSFSDEDSGLSIQRTTALIHNNTIMDWDNGIRFDDGWEDEYFPVSIKFNKIINTRIGIHSSYSKGIELQENEILGSGQYDLDLRNCEARLINTDYLQETMNFHSSIIIFIHHLNLNIIDEYGLPSNANITIFDTEGNLVYEGTCNDYGQITNIPLTSMIHSTIEMIYQGPYSIHMSNGSSEITTSVLMDRSKGITLILGDLGDLVIENEDLNLNEGIVQNNDIVNFKARVHNKGTQTLSNITVYFYILNNLIGESHIDEITPGKNETASFNWTAKIGEWEVRAYVHSESQEINSMGNNEASVKIRVVELAIDTNESYCNEIWEFNGDVVIEEGGILVLDNVTIIMNSSDIGLFWNISKGGELIMNYCNISAHDDLFPYYFIINGKATLNGSIFSGMGTGESSPGWWHLDSSGIQIYSDDVKISNCTIKNNEIGIYCGNSASWIYNNTIINNSVVGIECYNSNATISHNKLISNKWYGIYVRSPYYSWDSEPIIENNSISESSTGIQVFHSKASISNNTIFNNTDGIDCYESQILIFNNEILNNNNGISGQYSIFNFIENNSIKDNYKGINIIESICNITQNEIVNNEYGIQIGERFYNDDSISFIENNTVSSNSRSGILIYRSFPVIKNNFIGNNTEWGIDIINGDVYVQGNIYDYDNRSNGNGRIIKRYALDVKVRDPGGRYVEHVIMKITSSNGTIIAYEYLKYGDWYSISRQFNTTVMYIQNNSGNEEFFEYLLEIEKEGATNSTWISINESYEVNFQLILLPDLKIQELEVGKYFRAANDGRKPKEDDHIAIRVHVYNQGNGTANNITVRTLINGNLKDEQMILKILPKRTEHIEFYWKVKPGKIMFETQIDSEDNIMECNEQNNYATTQRQFSSLPEDLTLINTILIIFLTFLFIISIFWIRWRYELWRKD